MPNKPTTMKTELTLPPSGNLAWACLNDPTIHAMVSCDAPLSHIVGQLALEKQNLMDRILRLEQIAPRRITLPDGQVAVWHCPDHMVPET